MIVPTINRTRILPRIGVGYRAFAMKIREEINPLPPNFSMDAIRPPPHGIGSPQEADSDPMALVRKPVTAAYSVDAIGGKLSALDSSVFGAGGEVQHGTFGKINADGTIPLEYLALLRPAAEGAAALREMDVKNGTLLVYGATRPSGMAATQLASGQGCAVVAVVDGQHSGHDEMVDVVKGLTNEPGFAVAEEYALCKANFRDLVLRTVGGEDIKEGFNSAQFLDDFQRNLIDYTKTYPDDLPAAVDAEQLRFVGKEKDRANFKANMEAYLSQYSPGAAPIDEAQLKAIFDTEQYELFKKKFGAQTTAVISGSEDAASTFAPAEIVSAMITSPEKSEETAGDYPFEFSVKSPSGLPTEVKGGPIAGVVIEVTPELSAAAEALAKAKTLRAKAESLQFLTDGQRNAHAAASSLIALAKHANAPIRTVNGTLPGLTSVSVTENDIQAALDAMAIGDDGESKLNYFIQVYRAGDFEAYEAYGVHRASEPCAGPRTIIVTK
eukprot:scaffold12928_cov64-Cyclotella_meneghiniana.AAC.5